MKKSELKELIKEEIRIIIESSDSNLNDNFKRWFGNSKVVNSDGSPMIVYHGTNIEFNKFNYTKARNGWLSTGFYFTDDRIYAKDYGNKIISVFLSLRNPFVIEGDIQVGDGSIKWAKTVKEQINEKYPLTKEMDWKDVSNFLKTKGHDGIINSLNLICVFYPSSIKSVENDGSWDSNDDDIYS